MTRFLRRYRFWLALLLVALVAAGGYYYWQTMNAAPRGPAVVTVQRGDVRATINANGAVRSKRSARLSLPVSGLVAKVDVREGDAVKANDVLVELDNTDAARRLRQAELNVATRENELKRAQAAPKPEDLDAAQLNLRRSALALAAAQRNYNDNPTSQNSAAQEIAQIDYDLAKINFNRVSAGTSADDLKSLQNTLDFTRLDLESTRRAYDQTRLLAPFDGIVTDVTIRPGELIGGFNPVVTLMDTKSLEIRAEVDEIDVAHVLEGQNVELRFDAYPGETFTGRVTRLFPAASTDRGSTVYVALADFDAGAAQIRSGMGATLKVATVERKGVLFVPSRAVKSAGTQKYVTRLDASGTRQDLVVQTGVTNGSQTEIVSGVNEGDRVIIE